MCQRFSYFYAFLFRSLFLSFRFFEKKSHLVSQAYLEFTMWLSLASNSWQFSSASDFPDAVITVPPCLVELITLAIMIIDCNKKIKPKCPRPIAFEIHCNPHAVLVLCLSKIQRKSSPSTLKTNTQTEPRTGLQGREATLLEQARRSRSLLTPSSPAHLAASAAQALWVLHRRCSDISPISSQTFKPSQVFHAHFSLSDSCNQERLNGHVSISSFSTSPTQLIQVNL